jgi:predicted CxxxxCH...CXXCH cytochrome family protein
MNAAFWRIIMESGIAIPEQIATFVIQIIMQIQAAVKAKNSVDIATTNEFGVLMKRHQQILILTILLLSITLISCIDARKDPLPTAASDVSKNYSPYDCTSCHGSINAAPPKDLSGHTSISSPGVGVHQSHLLASHSVSVAVACNECHTVPKSANDTGHLDVTPGAEVTFQGDVVSSNLAALAGSAHPAYSHMTLKCDNTYCHGYFPNGNKTAPSWTDGSGQYRACGSCHGDVTKSTTGDRALPKTSLTGGFHPSNTNCSQCHSRTINASYQLNALRHINGQIDFN